MGLAFWLWLMPFLWIYTEVTNLIRHTMAHQHTRSVRPITSPSIRPSTNTRTSKNVMTSQRKSVNTMMLRSLTKKKSRFPRQFVIFQSTPVFLDIVLTQTFIPDSLDSVPQDTSPDTTPDTSLDTTLDTTQDTAVAILAARFVIFCFRIHNWISTT